MSSPSGSSSKPFKRNSQRAGIQEPLTALFDRQPPFDLQAEVGLIGSIFLLPDVIDEIAAIVRAEDFYDIANEKLFEHIAAAHDAGKKIDETLVLSRLKKAGDLETVGGTAYLLGIISAVPNAAHAKYYAEIVRDRALKRKVILKATELLRDGYDGFGDAEQLLAAAESAFIGVSDNFLGVGEAVRFNEEAHKAMAALSERMSGNVSGITTGIAGLDQAKRLQPGELVILAGRPAMGKSAAGCNVAVHVAKHCEKPVVFVTIEMRPIELVDRMLCAEARVDYGNMLRGNLTEEQRQQLVDASCQMSHLPLFIDDAAGKTVTQIAAQCRRLKRKHGGLSLVVIDYLQLIEPDDPKVPRQEQVAKISRKLKLLARSLDAPVLCLAQVNRQVEQSSDCLPKLSHLRESGSIEADADVVLFCHRAGYYGKASVAWAAYEGQHPNVQQTSEDGIPGEKAEILIAKARNAETKTVRMLWFGRWQRWDNPASNHHEQNYSAPYSDGGF